MKNLHSYWRMQYIEANDQNDATTNPFANLPKGGSDRDALILWRNRKSYLVLNKFPYNPGHLLALPYREVSDLSDLDTEERNDLMDSIIQGKELLSRAFSPDGFNVGFNFGCAEHALIGHEDATSDELFEIVYGGSLPSGMDGPARRSLAALMEYVRGGEQH